MSWDNFNHTVNGFLDPVFDNDVLRYMIQLFVIVFGGLAAPQIPPTWAPYLSNTYVRILVMITAVWLFDKDPATGILIAVGYFLTINYLLKNNLALTARTRIVSPALVSLLSGGAGPSIKPASVVQAEAQLMQSSIGGGSTGFVTVPEATLSTATSTGASAAIPTYPSGTPATVSSMMATHPAGGVPNAYTPDTLHDFAAVPK